MRTGRWTIHFSLRTARLEPRLFVGAFRVSRGLADCPTVQRSPPVPSAGTGGVSNCPVSTSSPISGVWRSVQLSSVHLQSHQRGLAECPTVQCPPPVPSAGTGGVSNCPVSTSSPISGDWRSVQLSSVYLQSHQRGLAECPTVQCPPPVPSAGTGGVSNCPVSTSSPISDHHMCSGSSGECLGGSRGQPTLHCSLRSAAHRCAGRPAPSLDRLHRRRPSLSA